MEVGESTKLTRDCQAVTVPEGQTTLLNAGLEVKLSQAMGDTFTLITEEGVMVRIDGRDADAIGAEVPEAAKGNFDPNASIEDIIWQQLKTCYDPEIPVNIVDLGLIYKCQLSDFEGGGHRVEVDMTLTAPGCGMGDVLCTEAQRKLEQIPQIKDVQVRLVWDPPWDRSKMSESALLELGMM